MDKSIFHETNSFSIEQMYLFNETIDAFMNKSIEQIDLFNEQIMCFMKKVICSLKTLIFSWEHRFVHEIIELFNEQINCFNENIDFAMNKSIFHENIDFFNEEIDFDDFCQSTQDPS